MTALHATPPHASRLRFAVMGAGSVGCYFGALLARAGHAVTLIGRPAHVQAVQAHGLRLQTATHDAHVALAASTDASAVAGADVVLLCVKSTDTELAARQIQPYLATGTLVLTLQNGVDNDERVRAVLGGCRTWSVQSENRPQRAQFLPDLQPHSRAMGQKDGEKWAAAVDLQPTISKSDSLLGAAQPVAAAVVYVATAMAGPGHVRHFGRGELLIGPCALAERLARELTAAGIPAQLSDNVRGALWAKLVINCAYNALSAIVQQPYGWLVQQDGATAVIGDLVAECLAVAAADGVQIPGDVHAAVRGIAQSMPGQLSSTAQDLARSKPSEIEHLNGYVTRPGAALGVATPVNRALLVLVRMLQAKAAA